jgi:hypothetical protein
VSDVSDSVSDVSEKVAVDYSNSGNPGFITVNISRHPFPFGRAAANI